MASNESNKVALRSLGTIVRKGIVAFCLSASVINAPTLHATDGLVISFHQHHPLMESSEFAPLVSVYSPGLALINRPKGYRNPGEFRQPLTEIEFQQLQELAQLASQLESSSIDFRQINGEPILTYSSDPTVSVIRFLPPTQTDESADTEAAPGPVQTTELSDAAAMTADESNPALSAFVELRSRLLELFSRAGN